MNLVTVARLHRNPTVKSEIEQKGFEESIPAGFFTYPVSQAADITGFKANLVPVGDDQLPMIEQAREIVRKFNSIYGDTLVEPEAVLPDDERCYRLVGTDGNAKMSKSLGNCIYLADSEEEIKKKVFNMYTDPNHIKIDDPGKIEGNVVFAYLDIFCKDDSFEKYLPEYKNLDELKAHYQKGGLGDMKIKKFLNSILQDELRPIRERREKYSQDMDYVYDVLKKGSEEARKVVAETLREVKRAMKIDYFE